MASKGQKFKKIPIETRLKVVQERLEQGHSFNYLGSKYGINKNSIKTWTYIFKRDGGLDIQKKGRPKKDGIMDYKERYEILKKFQDYLGEVDREKK